MDKLGSKKRLYAGLGDFARQRRMEEMRKKYSAAPPEMAEQMEKLDAAGEAASLPDIKKDVGALKVDKMEDVNNDDFERAMSEFSDEEDAKWMRKQRG